MKPSSRNGKLRRILELDGLRGIAILLVLGCHYPGFAGLFYRLPEFGWLGVDIFFALSGYLITTILLGLRDRSTPYRTFYSRRFIRILPPYIAASIVLFFITLHDAPGWLRPFTVTQLLFLQAIPRTTRHFVLSVLQNPAFHLTHLAPLLTLAHSLPLSQVGTGMVYASVSPSYWSAQHRRVFLPAMGAYSASLLPAHGCMDCRICLSL